MGDRHYPAARFPAAYLAKALSADDPIQNRKLDMYSNSNVYLVSKLRHAKNLVMERLPLVNM
jgi:hypothetical protein